MVVRGSTFHMTRSYRSALHVKQRVHKQQRSTRNDATTMFHVKLGVRVTVRLRSKPSAARIQL